MLDITHEIFNQFLSYLALVVGVSNQYHFHSETEAVFGIIVSLGIQLIEHQIGYAAGTAELEI